MTKPITPDTIETELCDGWLERAFKASQLTLAMYGQKPLGDNRQAPKLKRMMMQRFKEMTGKNWNDVR